MKSIVNQSKKNNTKINIFLGVGLLILIIIIALEPAKYSQVAMRGIMVWAKILLPSLLPFFILTKLFASTGVIDGVTSVFAPVTKKLYNCPSQSAYVFLMSILTGYPVGSKLVCDLYKDGTLTKGQAIRTTAFCSNSGPMFILGSVAIGMFKNRTMGYLILISHIIGAILNGLIYRKLTTKEKENINQPLLNKTINNIDLAKSVTASINSILLIGGIICLCFVLLEIITNSIVFVWLLKIVKKLGLNADLVSSIFCGIGEITKGCLMLSSITLSPYCALIICTFIISFGGISTFFQARAFLKDIVPTKLFLIQKITHSIIACVISAILGLMLL